MTTQAAANLQSYSTRLITRVNRTLEKLLPPAHTMPDRLHSAMRYSVLGDGKRLRPLFVYAAGEAFSVPLSELDHLAAAVECMHAYSLIHDDLPAMDDDDERRGRPSCHKFFDEATAILAGDALQTFAIEVLSSPVHGTLSADKRLAMIKLLANAVGSQGMAGGQQLDILMDMSRASLTTLEKIHILKTAKLIQAAILIGATASDALSPAEADKLALFGEKIGLCFQLRDDIDDIHEDSKTGAETPSFVNLVGLKGCENKLETTYQDALAALNGFGDRVASLKMLAHFAAYR